MLIFLIDIGLQSEITDKLLIVISGFLFFALIHLIRAIQQRSKRRNKTVAVVPSLEIESTYDEPSHEPVLNGDFLTDNILDNRFREISLYHLDLIKSRNSEEELKRIRFEKLQRLIDSINQFEPTTKSRDDKKLIIQYLKIFKKPINSFSYKDLVEIEKIHIFPIASNTDKYGWKFKQTWLLGLLFVLPIELIIWLIINLILGVFMEFRFYFIPILSTYYMISSIIVNRKKEAVGKLW